MLKPIKNLNLLSQNEKDTVLFKFNDTAVDYPKEKCVHQLFEDQVEEAPDKTAVIACDKTLTYRELNEQANRIAHSLIVQGIKVGDIVAFKLPRRSYLIATMLGILKAGAAYMPIDPDYPQDRIDYMLTDSDAKYCITEDDIPNLLSNDKTEKPNVDMTSDNICYCIYTSGSTGKPKGLAITHKNVFNFIALNEMNYFQKILIEKTLSVIATNTISFDITLQEIFLPICNGKKICFLDENEMLNIGQSEFAKTNNCLGLITTPTKVALYMKDKDFLYHLKNFSVIMIGAEALSTSLINEIQKYTNAIIFNGYGPTETTCGVSYGIIKNPSLNTITRIK